MPREKGDLRKKTLKKITGEVPKPNAKEGQSFDLDDIAIRYPKYAAKLHELLKNQKITNDTVNLEGKNLLDLAYFYNKDALRIYLEHMYNFTRKDNVINPQIPDQQEVLEVKEEEEKSIFEEFSDSIDKTSLSSINFNIAPIWGKIAQCFLDCTEFISRIETGNQPESERRRS